jgi:hypothetical protein
LGARAGVAGGGGGYRVEDVPLGCEEGGGGVPCGRCSPLGARAGVHRNTKVYMLPSNRDCMAPSRATFWSALPRKAIQESQQFHPTIGTQGPLVFAL